MRCDVLSQTFGETHGAHGILGVEIRTDFIGVVLRHHRSADTVLHRLGGKSFL